MLQESFILVSFLDRNCCHFRAWHTAAVLQITIFTSYKLHREANSLYVNQFECVRTEKLKAIRSSGLTNCSMKSLTRSNITLVSCKKGLGKEMKKRCFSLTTSSKWPFRPNWQLWLRAGNMAHTALP